jgi:hypothetical protein
MSIKKLFQISMKKSESGKERLLSFSKRIGIGSILIVMALISIKAQEQTEGIRMLARPYADSVQLRWAPSSYELWRAGVKNGYVIERYTILRNKELVKQSQDTKKVFDIVMPLPMAKWEPLMDIDKYCGIAAEAMFGESFTVTTGKTGSMYDIVNMSTEQSNRFSFALFSADMSTLAARSLGLMFTDKTANKNESYVYKVAINGYTVQKIDTGYVLTGFLEYRPLPKPSHLSTYKQGTSAVIAWDRVGTESEYTAFIVERAIGESGFARLNQEPLINPVPDENQQNPFFSYVDTLPSAIVKVQYRVCGISPFGERGPWSDTACISGQPALKEHPQITLYESKDAKSVDIGWDFPGNESSLSGFRVMRSNTDASDFKDVSGLLPSNTRKYKDKEPLPTNYYKVFAVGHGGDITMSMAVLVQPVDSFPPLPPTRLMASVDSTGKVTLHWRPNEEPDMYGYRVYRGNNLNEEFSQITIAPVRDTVFYDKININTITSNVYYQLMAIDKRQNHSTFSQTLEVKRPDFIAPVPPVFRSAEASEKGAALSWYSSTSSDVAAQELMRYTKDTSKVTLVARFSDMNIESFTDTSAIADTIYHYRFVAIDGSNNRSKPANVAAMSGRKVTFSFVVNAKARRDKGTIELTWNAPKLKNISRYIVYRGIGEEPLAAYNSALPPATMFSEKVPVVGTRYTYAVRIMYTDGSFGPVSDAVSIDY